MDLYSKQIKIFKNEYLKYLYEYDSEILYDPNKVRACMLVDIGNEKYAIPFRSNMKHSRGKVFKVHFSKYGLDFTKAIPIINNEILEDGNFLLKKVEQEYYKKDENYKLIVAKFKSFLEHVYYRGKEHTTDHLILEMAQKYQIIIDEKIFKIYNHKKDEVILFTSVINYENLYPIINKIYNNLSNIKEDNEKKISIIQELESVNKNIMVKIR